MEQKILNLETCLKGLGSLLPVRRRLLRELLFTSVAFASAHWASGATISAVILHPGIGGAERSVAVAVDGTNEVGWVHFNGCAPDGGCAGDRVIRAAKWSGSAASFRDITPGSPIGEYRWQAQQGWAYGIEGGTVIAELRNSAGYSAHSSPAVLYQDGSFTLMHPDGRAVAVSGGQYVGYSDPVNMGGIAWLWNSPGGVPIVLNPPGIHFAGAMAVHNGQQAGFVATPGGQHAALWSGSASSFVDLHPAGWDQSAAKGVHAGTQAGWVTLSYHTQHAALWTGTAESFVDLHPKDASYSWVNGVCGPFQVGVATDNHAFLWKGSAERALDLHKYLDPGYGTSVANAVWTDGQTTRVVGRAGENAVLWTIIGDPFATAPSEPKVNLSKAVRPSFSDLTVGSSYQLQVSTNTSTWSNQGAPFAATNSTMAYPQYWDVDNWSSMFFRLQPVP